jgi:hypothetical protein
VTVGLVLALVGFRPAGADEPLVPDAVSGTFRDSPGGFFAYFTGPAGGAWRMSHPHSAGHRRFELPAPVPARGR